MIHSDTVPLPVAPPRNVFQLLFIG
jgi:hypothetical protein